LERDCPLKSLESTGAIHSYPVDSIYGSKYLMARLEKIRTLENEEIFGRNPINRFFWTIRQCKFCILVHGHRDAKCIDSLRAKDVGDRAKGMHLHLKS